MRNVKTEVTKDNKLVITVDLNEAGTVSASGKSLVIGSTEGNVTVGDVKVGLNVYKAR